MTTHQISSAVETYFFDESQVGTITVNDNFIVVQSLVYNCQIEVNKLFFASVLPHYFSENVASVACLCLIDAEKTGSYFRKYLPCHFMGFRLAYEHLSANHNFDNAKFFEMTTFIKRNPSIDIEEKLIWRKKQTNNFSILTAYPNDILEGFEILAPTPVFIKWGTTERELVKQQPKLIRRKKPLRFSHSIRIGNLVIDEKFDYQKHELRFDLTLPFQRDNCYYELKNAIRKMCMLEGNDDPMDTLWSHKISFGTEQGRLTFILNYEKSGEYRSGHKVAENTWDFKDPDTTNFILRIAETDPEKLKEIRKQEEKSRKDAEHTNAYRLEHGY